MWVVAYVFCNVFGISEDLWRKQQLLYFHRYSENPSRGEQCLVIAPLLCVMSNILIGDWDAVPTYLHIAPNHNSWRSWSQAVHGAGEKVLSVLGIEAYPR